MAKPSGRDVKLLGRKVAERFAAIAPETVGDIRDEQGWDDETLLILVLGYLDDEGLSPALVAHLRACANEENAAATEYMDNLTA